MLAVRKGNQFQSSYESSRKRIQRANLPAAQKRFNFRPHFFNRIEIRTVWWKVERDNSLSLQYIPNSLDMMRAHVVHHNNISRM